MFYYQQSSDRILITGSRSIKITRLIIAGITGLLFLLIFLLPLQVIISLASARAISGHQSRLEVHNNGLKYFSTIITSSRCSTNPVAIFVHNGDQRHPRVAYNADDKEYLVVWEDGRSGNFDIYGQILPEGCPYEGNVGLIKIFEDSSLAGGQKNINQTLPDVIYNSDLKRYFVIWHDAEKGVLGQHFFAKTGQPVEDEPEKFFSESPVRAFTNSVVTYDGLNERYLLVTQRVTTKSFIVSRVVTASNLIFSSPFQKISENLYQQLGDVAHDTLAHTNLAIWAESSSPSFDFEVTAQKFDKDGKTTGTPIYIQYPSDQLSPAADFNNQCNGYLLVWEDNRNLNKSDIFRLSTSGALTSISAILTTPTKTEKKPDVTTNVITKEYLVAWEAKNDGHAYSNIYAQRVDCQGNLLAVQEPVTVTNRTEDQVSPAVTYLKREQKYLIIWSGKTSNSTTSFDIFAYLIDTNPTDIIRPRVIESTPGPMQMDVITSTSAVTVRFSEAMLRPSIWLSTTPEIDLDLLNPNWDESDLVVSFSLDSPLKLSQTYMITVTGTDKAGNVITESEVNPWSFTTTIPPRVVEVTPKDGDTSVPISTSIVITFSEAMLISTFRLVTTPTMVTAPLVWADGEHVVTISLESPLMYSQTYQVYVSGMDKANNEIDTKAGKNYWSFTTKPHPPVFLPFIAQCNTSTDLKNGDFESQLGDLSPWIEKEVHGHLVDLICVDDGYGYADFNNNTCVVRLGDPTLGLGDPNVKDVPNGYAAISQSITIPFSCSGSSVLKFDYHFCSYDTKEWKEDRRDALEVTLDPAGPVIGDIGFPGDEKPPDEPRCEPSSKTISLSDDYRGKLVNLTFTLWNREPREPLDQGNGYRKTWAYIDNIRFE